MTAEMVSILLYSCKGNEPMAKKKNLNVIQITADIDLLESCFPQLAISIQIWDVDCLTMMEKKKICKINFSRERIYHPESYRHM